MDAASCRDKYIFNSKNTGINPWKLTHSLAQEPEGSSPHPQQPATGPCPETVEFNPHLPSQSA
jgi:hypothetical protein